MSAIPAKVGFLISKPLQMLVAIAICSRLPGDTVVEFLVTDGFIGAEDVCVKFNQVGLMGVRALFFRGEHSAMKHIYKHGYAELYIDSDVGFKKHIALQKLKLLSPQTKLFVYEEGLGSYRSDLYRGPKKVILSSIGCGVFFGGNCLTKELYLYKPNEYRNKISAGIVEIQVTVFEVLKRHWNSLVRVFDVEGFAARIDSPAKGKCRLYLTSWEVSESMIAGLLRAGELLIVKPHPHIKQHSALRSDGGYLLASGVIPAEMLIYKLCSIFDCVEVVHHGTSATRYISPDNVTYRNFANC